MTLGGATQVAAAHCPNKRTLDPTVRSYNRPTQQPQPAAYGLHPLRRSWPISWKYDVKPKTWRVFTWRPAFPNFFPIRFETMRLFEKRRPNNKKMKSDMGSVPDPKIEAWRRELHAFRSLIVSFFAWHSMLKKAAKVKHEVVFKSTWNKIDWL